MARKKRATATPTRPAAAKPRTFGGLIRRSSRPVQEIAKALRALVVEELPDVEESFYGGQRPMAMYRTTADVCWIQPLKTRCNLYLLQGTQLRDDAQQLEGSSDRMKHAKVGSLEDFERLPLREWLRESQALNEAATQHAMSVDQVRAELQRICLALPNTKETITWGKPHFRVGEKIFCGCGEDRGAPRIGLKMEAKASELLMKLPGVEKAPYSRKGDGWVSIDPAVFDDWEEIEQLLVGSFRLIAPKRLVAQLDAQS